MTFLLNKKFIYSLTFAGSTACTAAFAQTITIDNIVCDQVIEGSVSGLAASGFTQNKVLVFVKAGNWWIHPFHASGQAPYDDEGYSWAEMSSVGDWDIGTKSRGDPISHVAAVIVPKEYRLARAENRALPAALASVVVSPQNIPGHQPGCF